MFGINHSYPVSVAAGIVMAEWARRYWGRERLVAVPGRRGTSGSEAALAGRADGVEADRRAREPSSDVR